MSTRLGALAYLAWRALAVHPVKRAAAAGGGRERFLVAYAGEGLEPTTAEDRAAAEAASACIGCGLCESACAMAAAVPSLRDLGLHATFRLYSKSAPQLLQSKDGLDACAGCTGCEPLCPTGVPIARLVRWYQGRAAGWLERGGP